MKNLTSRLPPIEPALDPAMPAAEAVKRVLRAELAVIQLNEPYITQDIDTEFLHDYRVALRRTRAILVQMKGVFSVDVTARFKVDLRQVSRFTNRLRDLDVFLLAEPAYQALLPGTAQAGLGLLFDYLRQQRPAVFQEAVAALHSAPYRRVLADWESFLNEPAALDDGRAIFPLVCERIDKRYGRVLKDGNQVLLGGDNEQMHRLRLECKKLRYLLALFASLFPPNELSHLINQLKNLQTNLGDFNDLCVQEAYLKDTFDELSGGAEQMLTAVPAIKMLIVAMQEEQNRLKSEFRQALHIFIAPENQALFQQLFGSQERPCIVIPSETRNP